MGWVLAACSPAMDWREVDVGDTALVGRVPCHPSRFERRVEVAGRPLKIFLLSCEQAGVTYGLSTAEVEDPARVDEVLAALAQASARGIGATDPDRIPFTIAGVTPYQGDASLRLRGRGPDGRPVEEAIDLFARGTRVFQATAIGSQLAPEVVGPFHEGLHFRGLR